MYSFYWLPEKKNFTIALLRYFSSIPIDCKSFEKYAKLNYECVCVCVCELNIETLCGIEGKKQVNM